MSNTSSKCRENTKKTGLGAIGIFVGILLGILLDILLDILLVLWLSTTGNPFNVTAIKMDIYGIIIAIIAIVVILLQIAARSKKLNKSR